MDASRTRSQINSAKKNVIKDDIITNYIRVGDSYYKYVEEPQLDGSTRKVLTERAKSSIKDDFGHSTYKDVEKYDGFVCIPEHINYRQTVNSFYNRYHKFSHIPAAGSCKTIMGILEHIFGKEGLNFILDYIKNLLEKPTQNLPVLLLESVEKNTGKSTFGNLLCIIFEGNAVKMGNSDFQSNFNSVYADKLIIVVDETQIDKSSSMQLIKRLSTEKGKMLTNEKFKNATQTEFFGKLIFISNEEGRALPIEKGDTRFAVFKAPTFDISGVTDIPDIEKLIKAEMPAFIDFILKREFHFKKESRLYFNKKVYHTEQLDLYLENATTYLAKAIKDLVKHTFENFEEELVEKFELNFTIPNILDELKSGSYISRATDRKKVELALKELGVEKYAKKKRYTYHSLNKSRYTPEHCTDDLNTTSVYIFIREKFMDG
jgi:hypothetical protein